MVNIVILKLVFLFIVYYYLKGQVNIILRNNIYTCMCLTLYNRKCSIQTQCSSVIYSSFMLNIV